MTEKANNPTSKEVASRLPKSFQILARWAAERKLIKLEKEREEEKVERA